MTNRENGERLIKEAERVFARDLKSAWEEKDYNLTVRRAQEVVELVLKGALKILGVDYPKIHDVGPVFKEQARSKLAHIKEDTLERVLEISFWLGEARAPSFYLEKDYGEGDAQKALEDAEFVLKEIKRGILL